MHREVSVSLGDIIPRIVTDKEIYHQYEGGYATFEYYNPKTYNVTFMPPSGVDFYVENSGVKSETGWGVGISWIRSSFTVEPGKTFRIHKFVFTTSEVGELTLVMNGIRKTVQVLPIEP